MPLPYWDSDNRYCVAGPSAQGAGFNSKPTIYAWLVQHPSGYWQWRCGCGGQMPDCRSTYSPHFYNLADAQTYVQNHLLEEHFVVPPK